MAKQNYKRYDYNSDVGIVTRDEQIKEYLDKKFSSIDVDVNVDMSSVEEKIEKSSQDTIDKIESSTQSTIEKLEHGLGKTNCHIERAKNEIINNSSCCNPCQTNTITKDDITNAINEINSHTDDKFNEIDFEKQFSDLNEQIKNLNK